MKTIALREVAHSRSGEKGNSSTISVIAHDPADYDRLREQVTVEAVRRIYGPITRGAIERFEVPAIGALNFALDEVLEGGRSRTLAFEESGKALSSLMLTLPIQVPDDHVGRAERVRRGLPAVPNGAPAWAESDGRRVRLGSAAAWSRDRFEPALALLQRGAVDYLCFDSMSEVTMSAAQVARIDDDRVPPYDPYLEERIAPLLRECKERGVRIITNQGWMDPAAAARKILALAKQQGIADLRVGVVEGAMLTDRITRLGVRFIEDGELVEHRQADIVSAEAYLGARGIVQALAQGADIVVTTRIADSCLYLGPLAHEFSWSFDDPQAMARGTIIGHLMECGAQLSGGYFADPGYKDVPDLVDLGNPIVEVSQSRQVLSKLPGSGGLLSEATCKEQLLYEVGDPRGYLVPDCIADLTRVRFIGLGRDEVEVMIDDGAGAPRPPTLKTLVSLTEGYMTEEMVIFAGPGALARARATQALLEERFRMIDLRTLSRRFDYLGVNAVHREASPQPMAEPYEVVLRIAIATRDRKQAEKLRREIDPLAVNGLSATGKWATSAPGSRVRAIVGLNSCLVSRDVVHETVRLFRSDDEDSRQ